jgi:hypothetical protein
MTVDFPLSGNFRSIGAGILAVHRGIYAKKRDLAINSVFPAKATNELRSPLPVVLVAKKVL